VTHNGIGRSGPREAAVAGHAEHMQRPVTRRASGRHTVFGPRVRQARLMSNMHGSELSAALGRSSMSTLEQQWKVSMSARQLSRLCKVLHYPPTFFQSEPFCKVDSSTITSRISTQARKAEKERRAVLLALLGEILGELSRRSALPALRIGLPSPSTDPVAAARSVRRSLGLAPDEPIQHLMHAIERAGVPILMTGIAREAHGRRGACGNRLRTDLAYSAWLPEVGPVIALTALGSWEKTRFVLARQLGHVVLHPGAGDLTVQHEAEASRFAAELLAPYTCLAGQLSEPISLGKLVPVKMRWGISLADLATHLRANDAISDQRYQTICRQISGRTDPDSGHTWTVTEPGWDRFEPERPRLLTNWLQDGYDARTVHARAELASRWGGTLVRELLHEQRPAGKAADEHRRRGAVIALADYRPTKADPRHSAGHR